MMNHDMLNKERSWDGIGGGRDGLGGSEGGSVSERSGNQALPR